MYMNEMDTAAFGQQYKLEQTEWLCSDSMHNHLLKMLNSKMPHTFTKCFSIIIANQSNSCEIMREIYYLRSLLGLGFLQKPGYFCLCSFETL